MKNFIGESSIFLIKIEMKKSKIETAAVANSNMSEKNNENSVLLYEERKFSN